MHRSRLLTLISSPVSDMLKPAYAFGGLPMIQKAKPYIDNFLSTRQNVHDAVRHFSVYVLMTNMGERLGGNASDGSDLASHVDAFNRYKKAQGTLVLDKEAEDFKNVAMPLGGLDRLQAQSQEQVSSVSRIPLVKASARSASTPPWPLGERQWGKS